MNRIPSIKEEKMFTYKLITNEKDVDLKRSTKRSKSNKTLEFIQDRIYIPLHQRRC